MSAELLPLHTYIEGDAFCAVAMANLDQTFSEFAESTAALVQGCRLEFPKGTVLGVVHNGKILDGGQRIRDAKLLAFERVDIRPI
jgi:hypothetical protein